MYGVDVAVRNHGPDRGGIGCSSGLLTRQMLGIQPDKTGGKPDVMGPTSRTASWETLFFSVHRGGGRPSGGLALFFSFPSLPSSLLV